MCFRSSTKCATSKALKPTPASSSVLRSRKQSNMRAGPFGARVHVFNAASAQWLCLADADFLAPRGRNPRPTRASTKQKSPALMLVNLYSVPKVKNVDTG